MRILVAASTFPRRTNDDLPDFVWQQIRHLKQLSPATEIVVLAPHDDGAEKRETWEDVRIERFQYIFPQRMQRLAYPAILPNILRSPWLALQVPFLLSAEFVATIRQIVRFQPDVVYSHWFIPQGVACGVAALITGTPHVFTSHSNDVAIMRKLPLIGPLLVRIIVRRARAITSVSQRSKKIIESFFDSSSREGEQVSEKIAVIPMGVDTRGWQKQLRDATTEASPGRELRPVLLFIGRLVAKKGLSVLLKALTQSPLQPLEPTLNIMGDGPIREDLEATARKLGIAESVNFLGFLTGQQKASQFQKADLIVIPSVVTPEGDSEGLPVVLLEALAAGKICVASDASNAADVIEPSKEGFIVPSNDARALASAIHEGLTMNPREKALMSKRALKKAAEYDWRIIARRHAKHLFTPA